MNFRFVNFLVLFALSFSMLGVVNAVADINLQDVNISGLLSGNVDINYLFSGTPLSVIYDTNNVGDLNVDANNVWLMVTAPIGGDNNLNTTNSMPMVVGLPDSLPASYAYNGLAWGPQDVNFWVFLDGEGVTVNNLVTRTINVHAVDLTFNSLSVTNGISAGNVEYGSTVTFDVNMQNKINGAAYDLNGSGDANVLFYWNGAFNSSSLVDDTNLFGGNNNIVSFSLPGNNTGTYDLNIDMIYLGTDTNVSSNTQNDGNNLNNITYTTINVLAADLNAVSIASDSTKEFGLPLTVDVSFNNIGDYNGSDSDLNLTLTDNNTSTVVDFNSDFNSSEGDYNTDLVPIAVSFSYTPDSSILGAVDLNFNITYAGANGGDDNDLTNNSLAWTDTNIVSVDANAQQNSFSNLVIDSTTLEYGTTVPVALVFTYVNSGDSNGSDDVNVVFNFNTADENSVIDAQGDYNTGDTVTNNVLYNASGLAVGSYDLNARAVYDSDNSSQASEFTTSNNYTTVATLDVNAVDLNVQSGATIANAKIDANSVEFGVPLNFVFAFVNNGTYDGNGDVNGILRYGASDVNSTIYTSFGIGSTKYTNGANTVLYTPTATTASVDVNFRVDYDANTAGASEAELGTNSTTVTIDILAVDLNAKSLTLYNGIDSNTTELGSTVIFGFQHINDGTYDGNGDINVILRYGASDVNSNSSDTNFAQDINNDVNFSYVSSATTASTDVNARVSYDANTTNALEEITTNNSTVLAIDVVAVDLNTNSVTLYNGIDSNTVELGGTVIFGFQYANAGTYDGNGNANVIFRYGASDINSDVNDSNFTTTITNDINYSYAPSATTTSVDVNMRTSYLPTNTGALDSNTLNNSTVLAIDVVAVDLNAETLLINDSSASSVAVEVDQNFTVDFNFANRGNYNGDGNVNVAFDFNGGTDENTQIDNSFNVNTVNSVPQVSVDAGSVVENGIDLNVNISYSPTHVNADENDDYGANSVNVLSRDINVVSVDLNAESLGLDDSSVTTNTAVTATLTFSNVQDDINGAEDLNILFYVGGTLTDYNDDLTQGEFDNVDGDLTVSFSYTPTTAGSYDLNILLDYLGTEDDETNNSENATLTATAPVATTSPSGGGGTSGAKKETGTESTEYEFNYGSAESPLYIDTVEVNYEVGKKESANLKVILPNMADADKITDEDVTVIKYLELKYSGDQSKIVNAIVNFTVGKDEASDPALVKLGRLKDGVWTYFTPSSFVDNGTFYTFEVEVPGFSYFAVVLKASAPGEIAPVKEPAKETVEGTEPATTEPSTTPETTPAEETSTGLAWWIWTIIAVVVVVVIVFVIMGLRK